MREIISSAMWEHLNGSHLMLTAAAGDDGEVSDPHELFASVKTASQAFTGITDTTMTHNEAGISAGWAGNSSGPTRPRGSSTSNTFSCCRR